MAYGYTNFYNIPYATEGDFISAEQERRQAQIIENQLVAANRFLDCVVIKEGEFSLQEEDDGVVLEISSYGRNPAVMGIVNGGLCLTYSTMTWKKVPYGKVYYYYVDWTSEMFEEHEHFNLSVTDIQRDLEDRKTLLMAVVDTTTKKVRLNERPEGKLYVESFTKHVSSTENPHGPEMKVDKIVTGEAASAGDLKLTDARVSVKLSDESDSGLQTESRSLVGAINELYERLNRLERQEEADMR